MRILIVSLYFPPANNLASVRAYSWAKNWVLAGHDVTVLTMEHLEEKNDPLILNNPGFKVISTEPPKVVQRLKKQYRKHFDGEQRGLKKVLFGWAEYLRSKKGVFNACRMPDITHLWTSRALHRVMHEHPWDIVVSSANPYTVHLLAAKLKKRGMARAWVADYRETWSDNFVYPGVFPFNMYERHLEDKLLQFADMVTTVSESFSEQFSIRKSNGHILTIEHGFDFDELNVAPAEPLLPQDGVLRIIHTGSLYPGKRDPTELFKALQLLAKDPQTEGLLKKLEVLFIGHRQGNLEQLIDKYKVKNWVKPFGHVSRDTALLLQREAHALIYLPWNDPSVDGILPGKIFEYLTSGTPIMAIGCPEIEASQRLILETGGGVLLPRAEQIKEYLAQRLHGIEKEKVSVAETLLNRYDQKVLAERLLRALEEQLHIS